ncbi:hypothetical protein [Tessaracoccus palaemonis]|uniref:Energy-coupling factor transport system substrate-specific component n=1 Tax=Tessaracoccus palaemonis TaxID=2829499 RepID=A0ABX8SJQ5_9ACTN|nr:hypothetical protein [Tessaracoccus palaemonis]QXT63607.1 hypothetical protein KDB89_03780 [Tessaracoccus palaemonis]
MRHDSPTTGALPRAALAGTALLGYGWLTWPLWDSAGAADTTTLGAELPWMLAAVIALSVLLGLCLWLTAGRTWRPLTPIAALAAAGSLSAVALHPGASGVEFAYAFPLIAGVVLGSPAGFLTGVVSALGYAVAADTVATPLVGQVLVWGLWGMAGGLLRLAPTKAAAAGATLLALPLGVLSGALLNLTGWPSETAADAGAFLPGVGLWESTQRLASYTWATSVGYDLTRAITTAAFLALAGGPLIHLLRRLHDARTLPVEVSPPATVRVAPSALRRRASSDRLANLWNTAQGDPDE